MPAKKSHKKLLIPILLLVILVLMGIIIFILTSSKKQKAKSLPRTSATIFEQAEEIQEVEKIDKEEFCEKEGPEMLAYIDQLILITDKAAQGMAKRGEAVASWPNWTGEEIDEFTAGGDEIEDAYSEIRNLTPPDAYISLHEKFLNGLRYWSEGVHIGDKGFINQNQAWIDQCVSLTTQGNQWINKAKNELREISQQF